MQEQKKDDAEEYGRSEQCAQGSVDHAKGASELVAEVFESCVFQGEGERFES